MLVVCLSFVAHQPLWVIQCQIRFTYMNYIFVTIFYMNSLFLRKLTFLLNSCFDLFDPQVLGNVKQPFIAVTPRSTQTHNSSTF